MGCGKVIYGPYRSHASRGRYEGTKPTPWDEEQRRNGARGPATPDVRNGGRAGRRFTVKALEDALRSWLTGLGR